MKTVSNYFVTGTVDHTRHQFMHIRIIFHHFTKTFDMTKKVHKSKTNKQNSKKKGRQNRLFTK